MSYDFYAKHHEKPHIRNWNQYTILKCTKIGDDKNYKKSIQRFYKRNQIKPQWIYTQWFIPEVPTFDKSIVIKIDFKLKKHYISKDDEEFWPKDNPICRDKIFKIPLVRASTWKGTLSWVAYKQFLDKFDKSSWKNDRLRLSKLFGNEKENITYWLDQTIAEKLNKNIREVRKEFEKRLYGENRKGRLSFYPTFFDEIGLDVIAPHDRKTRTVTKPILFETVPAMTKGEFYLLYFPFDVINDKKRMKEETLEDFKILTESIPAMFEKYGFGAKTSSGYGVAEIEKIEINSIDCNSDWDKFLEVVENELGN